MSEELREAIEYRLYHRDSYLIKLFGLKFILVLMMSVVIGSVYHFQPDAMPAGKEAYFGLQAVLLVSNLCCIYLGWKTHKHMHFDMAMVEAFYPLNKYILYAIIAPAVVNIWMFFYMLRPQAFVEDIPATNAICVVAALFSFWAAYFCFIYRRRKLLVVGSEIQYTNCFGFTKSYHIFDIADIRVFDGFIAKNNTGKTLFRFEKNMLGYEEMLQYIPALSKRVEGASKTGFLDEQDKAPLLFEWERSQLIRKCRIAKWVMYILDMIAVLVELFLFWQVREWRIMWYDYEFAVSVLLLFLIIPYIWLFHEVLVGDYTDLGKGVFENMDKESKRQYRSMHVSLTPFLVPISVNLLLGNAIMPDGWVYLSGFWVNLACVLAVMGLSIMLTRMVLGKTRKAFLAAVASLAMLAGVLLPNAAFWKFAHDTDRYPVSVVEMEITEKDDQNSCYVTVRLQDGREKAIKVSCDMYCDIYYGRESYVQEKASLLGVRLAEVVY